MAHDEVVAVVGRIVPAVAGWQPWFDEAEDSPMEIPGAGEVYTQHL